MTGSPMPAARWPPRSSAGTRDPPTAPPAPEPLTGRVSGHSGRTGRMCHDHDSRPPAPPRRGDVAERGVLTLTAADGTDFSAAYAAPATSAGTGVVLLPDVRGLHPFYVALAEEFARAGLPTVAIDWFGRTAGVAEGGVRGAECEWRPHVEAATPEGMDADIAAGIAYLREWAGAELP